MRKLLRSLTSLIVIALVALLVISYFEQGNLEGSTPATDLLIIIRDGFISISKSINNFIKSLGIKEWLEGLIKKSPVNVA